jgi:lysophospholipid acyltransferase (LPLAT)-like uncharacterized protein
MKKKIREFISKHPWLDELRTSVMTTAATSAIDFFNRSYPVTRVVSKKAQEFLESGEPGIIAIYHGRFGGMAHFYKDKGKVTGLVSLHRDGELLARFGKALGYNVVRGSATYKAVEGALQLVHAAKAGQSPCITVDGPKGPIYKVKPGVIRLAEITGLPIIPFVAMCRVGLTLRNWDRMTGGYWGTPFVYVIGDPINVPKDASKDKREELRLQLEADMDRLREFSDGFWHPKEGALARL